MNYQEYVQKTKQMYVDRYSKPLIMPTFWDLESEIQERMMRVGIEVKALEIDDSDVEKIMIVAYCTILRDRMRESNR
jgi:hypothetical protein